MKFATDAALLAKLPLLSGQSESPWMSNKLAFIPDTPLLKAWATYWDSKQVRAFDVSWYVGHENDTTYTLDSIADLLGFALVAETNNFAGKTIKLGKDIVLNTGKPTDWANTAPENVWKPVVEFAGKFDGNGHTISGVYIKKMVNYSGNWEAAGFFETLTETAEVCNLGIVNSYIRTDTYYTGAIAGVSYAKRIENVYSDAYIHNTHSSGTWDGHSLGGLIGEMGTKAAGKTHMISKVWFDGKIYSYGHYDENSKKLFDTIGDGTLFIIDNRMKYLRFCAEHSKKTIFAFGITLTDNQKELVRKELNKIKSHTYRWKCVQELNKKEDFGDYASCLYRSTNAKFYKFTESSYKLYFALWTNCVKLVDNVLKAAGGDILRLNGVITPGAYYYHLNNEFKKKKSNVIRKEIITNSDIFSQNKNSNKNNKKNSR
jgi:hypothetical protein